MKSRKENNDYDDTNGRIVSKKQKKEGYGVAAPNVFNRETIEACFLAAKKLRAPIILDVAAVHGIYECADIARYYEKQYPEVPFALNLDHGGAYEDIVKSNSCRI